LRLELEKSKQDSEKLKTNGKKLVKDLKSREKAVIQERRDRVVSEAGRTAAGNPASVR